MIAIAVLGANGQVGSEVCLSLSTLPGVRVVPICRTELGTAYLRRCGLACRVGSVANFSEAKALLFDCDVVADFTLPRIGRTDGRAATKSIIENAMRAAPSRAAFVYASTTMAFGMPANSTHYGTWLLGRTVYSADKRRAERWARIQGVLRGRPTYVLRLGQVHGELQRVSHAMLERATAKPVALRERGAIQSDTVFCSTIATALVNIGMQREVPGTYTLLEAPEWTWRQVYEFYGRESGRPAQILDGGPSPARRRPSALSSLKSELAGIVRSFAATHKDMALAHVLPELPFRAEIERRLTATWGVARARAETRGAHVGNVHAPEHLDGPVPGERLSTLNNTERERIAIMNDVRTLLHSRLGADSHVFPMAPFEPSRRDDSTPKPASASG